MPTDEQVLNIRVELRGESKRKFNAIKKKLGLENNTEVLRSLIEKHAAVIEQQEAVTA